jgi:hypothetical protein
MRAIDGHGPLLTRAKVALCFRGAGWTDAHFTTTNARDAFFAAIASPYMSSLVQYRGIRRAEIVFSTTDLTNIGALGPDPRKFVPGNVWRIPDADIRSAVKDLARMRPAGEHEEVLYFVVINQSPIPIVLDELDASGYHSQFESDGRSITYAVALNIAGQTTDHTFRFLTGVFTHELVEACTDPDTTSGYRLDNGDELADLNDTREITLPGLDHAVELAAYWSELDQEAVVPTSLSFRIAAGLSRRDTLPSARAVLNGRTMRTFILQGFNP